MSNNKSARLGELYVKEVRPVLQKRLELKNIMQVPRVEKIVINAGVKGATTDSKIVQYVADVIGKIAGQKPINTKAKKSIAGFKLREGVPIGVKVTLRRERMYDFLDKLINLALPKERDFHGVSSKFDGRGNFNLGIQEWVIFSEVDQGAIDRAFGINITIQTSAKNDEHARELLKSFKFPFRASEK